MRGFHRLRKKVACNCHGKQRALFKISYVNDVVADEIVFHLETAISVVYRDDGELLTVERRNICLLTFNEDFVLQVYGQWMLVARHDMCNRPC